MSAGVKREIIEMVRRSPLAKKWTLADLGITRSTFYRWQRRQRLCGDAGLVDRKPDPAAVWNRLQPEERDAILREAMRQPELSPRKLAFHLIDRVGVSVSNRRYTEC